MPHLRTRTGPRPEPNEARSPSLRIGHVVYGRVSRANRVTYLVDPDGEGEERAIPEEVVLRRWRRRKARGWSFSGARLSSTVWRAIPACLGKDYQQWQAKVFEGSSRSLARRPAGDTRLRLPPLEALRALFEVCGIVNVRRLVHRHVGFEEGRSGVPDLFLFRRSADGMHVWGVFVEVKKPEEPVSPAQEEEVAFLRGIGLEARVLRLVER